MHLLCVIALPWVEPFLKDRLQYVIDFVLILLSQILLFQLLIDESLVSDVNEKPVNLCLLDAISVIPEKSPSNSVIGRLAIEDPDHPESKGACSKPSIVGPLHYYAYTCSIYSASMNIDDIKKKFYIDQSFQLHRKSDFDYRTKDVYNIPILCRDKEKPIHLIEKVFIVRIQGKQDPFLFVELLEGLCVL